MDGYYESQISQAVVDSEKDLLELQITAPVAASSAEQTVQAKVTAHPVATEQSITWEPTATVTPLKPYETPTPGVDLDACIKQNTDFVAWITIPGTVIDYPVVQSNNT